MADGICEACERWKPIDRCHIRSRGAGGSTDYFNILLMCRYDHQLQHSQGWVKFCEIYPHMEKVLNERGWCFKDVFGVMKLCRK